MVFGVKQTTIDKCTTHLKSILIKISKDPGISSVDYCRQNHLPSGFFSALLSLKYISSHKEGLFTKYDILMPSFGVTEEHGKKIAEWINNYNHNHRDHSCKEKVNNVVQLTDKELLDELKKRGYIGELTKINIIKL